jgi:energy-coupling factor transporter ATP-binding protein EcfA2
VYDIMLAKSPNDPALLRKKADLFREIGDYDGSWQLYEQSSRLAAEQASNEVPDANAEMTLTGIEFRGLDFFGDFDWRLRPRINILLGRNGYGKTILLKALAGLMQADDRPFQHCLFEDSAAHTFMRLDLLMGNQPQACTRRRYHFEGSCAKVPLLAIPDARYLDRSANAISADATQAGSLDLGRQGAELFLAERPFMGLLSHCLFKMCIDYLEQKKENFGLPIFRLTEHAIRRLTGGAPFEFTEIARVGDTNFVINVRSEGNERRPVPLQQVSQGTLSIVAIVSLIHSHLRSLYQRPATDDTAAGYPGIVVIDEVDAHLHPQWQGRVMPLLQELFPRVQFIVTAQNPLIVAGSRPFEVAVLHRRADGFVVETLADGFVGAISSEIYRKVFDIEEKDEEYLRLNALEPDWDDIEAELRQLAAKSTLSAEEQARCTELENKLQDLAHFRKIRQKRRRLEDSMRQMSDPSELGPLP